MRHQHFKIKMQELLISFLNTHDSKKIKKHHVWVYIWLICTKCGVKMNEVAVYEVSFSNPLCFNMHPSRL